MTLRRNLCHITFKWCMCGNKKAPASRACQRVVELFSHAKKGRMFLKQTLNGCVNIFYLRVAQLQSVIFSDEEERGNRLHIVLG